MLKSGSGPIKRAFLKTHLASCFRKDISNFHIIVIEFESVQSMWKMAVIRDSQLVRLLFELYGYPSGTVTLVCVSLTSVICIHKSKAKLSRFFCLGSCFVHDSKIKSFQSWPLIMEYGRKSDGFSPSLEARFWLTFWLMHTMYPRIHVYLYL